MAAPRPPIAALLAELTRTSALFTPQQEMMQGMSTRLADIAKALEASELSSIQPSNQSPPPKQFDADPERSRSSRNVPSVLSPAASSSFDSDLMTAFVAAVRTFVDLGHKYAMTRDSHVYRLASTRQMFEDLAALYSQLDADLDAPLRRSGAFSQKPDEPEKNEFRRILATQRANEEEQMALLSKGNPRPFVSSRRGHEPMESLTLLKFELDFHKADHSKQHVASMKAVFFSIVRSSNGRVAKIPGWYLPPYYLRYDQTKSEKQTGIARVFRGDLNAAQDQGAGKSVAIKAIAFHVDAVELFQREVEIWSAIDHVNVLKLAGASHCSYPTLVITEWAANGTLREYLGKIGAQKRRAETWRKFREAILGLLYLRKEMKMVHGNLKPQNLLVDADAVVKVTDFGRGILQLQNVTMQEDMRHSEERPRAFDPTWRAPECRTKQGRPTFRSDVFSLGLCLLDALEMELPTAPHFKLTQSKAMNNDEWMLLRSMCNRDPKDRLELSQVLEEVDKIVAKC
ncbi:hypothetical protein BBJ28_00011422 [Nothophytophthora sp. Chile5]|nr:hypothetical protein BBJ28_00011422 [Nothophytophthora sp. Chile5]